MAMPMVMLMKRLETAPILNGFAYVTCNTSNLLYKIDLSTFISVGSISVSTGPNGIIIDNGFAYIACSSGYIDKINLSTFINVEQLYIGNSPFKIEINNGFIYVTHYSHYKITKINLSTFVYIRELRIGCYAHGIIIYNGIMYIGGTNSNRIFSIDLNTFTNLSNVQIYASVASLKIHNGFIYATRYGFNAIAKISIATFMHIGDLGIPGIEHDDSYYDIVIDNNTSLMYVNSPGIGYISKIDLTTFSIINTYNTIYVMYSMYIYDGFLYITHHNNNIIGKYDLTSLLAISFLPNINISPRFIAGI